MAAKLETIMQRWSRQRLPQQDGRIYLKALHHHVDIRWDRWGIPHMLARSRHDLFLAQGFVHAQERLWQMELNRRAATGTLSAVFGPITLETDRLSRTFGFARLAQSTLEKLGTQAYDDLNAYTKGVNAYLKGRQRLPIEFDLLRHRPLPWQMLDSLAYAYLQMWALTHGGFGELVKAQILKHVDGGLAQDLLVSYPENHPATLPEGIEENAQWIDTWRGTAVPWQNPFLGKGNLDGAGRGSNGWVIAPQHSQTQGALLCNDMHLPMGAPSIWHFQHLRSEDGPHVAGFSQPGLPYVLAGHNDHVAWGVTLAYTDCEDIFIEKLHPEDGNRYQFGDQWLPVNQIDEEIDVRFQKAHIEPVRLTHHGPLIHSLLKDIDQPLAFCSTALQPGLTIDGFGWLNSAKNWDEFVTAVSRIHAPSLNLLYADDKGNIGHWVTGRVPIRAAGDGSVPSPGWDGKHEWIGFIPFEEMPHALNPRSGYIVSANNQLLPHEKSQHNLGQMWRNGYRANRLDALLQSKTAHSLADCRGYQLDLLCPAGLQLAEILAGHSPNDPAAKLALEQLQLWDGYLHTNTIGGTVFQVLVEQLTSALLSGKVPENLLPHLLGKGISDNFHPVNEFQGYWLVNLLRILAKVPNAWFGSVAERDNLLNECLSETTAVLKESLGENPADWRWGKLHTVTFQHALGRIKPFDQVFNIGPLPLGGDGNTVAQAGMRPGSFTSDSIGVSSRMIIDMSRIEQAEAMLAPGQSGHLGSPHYHDLVALWQSGENFSVLWNEQAILANARHTLTLARRP